MPGAVPITSTKALTNATLPYVEAIADQGLHDAVAADRALARGVNVVDGRITYEAVAEAHELDYTPLEGVLPLSPGLNRAEAAPRQEVREHAERQRQPVADQPVRERGDGRGPGADAREREQPGQPRLDEPEPARRDRDHRQQLRGAVGEQDERRPRPRPERGQDADEGEVVERPLPGRADRRGHRPVGERAADLVSMADEMGGQVLEALALRRPVRLRRGRGARAARAAGRTRRPPRR